MAGLKKKRRIQLIAVGFVLIGVASAAIGFGFRQGIQLYRSPSEIAASPPRPGEVFKLGGMVLEGSWQRGETNEFTITDYASDMRVRYSGIVPDLFGEGQGTIVTGRMEDGVFVASEVLAKHDESYMPKEVADSLQAQAENAPSE